MLMGTVELDTYISRRGSSLNNRCEILACFYNGTWVVHRLMLRITRKWDKLGHIVTLFCEKNYPCYGCYEPANATLKVKLYITVKQIETAQTIGRGTLFNVCERQRYNGQD